MCLVEVLDRHLPWTGCGNTGVVPLRVVRDERPEAELREADRARSGKEGVAQLVRDCWEHEPRDRPSFADPSGDHGEGGEDVGEAAGEACCQWRGGVIITRCPYL